MAPRDVTVEAFPGDWMNRLADLPRRLAVNVAGYPMQVEITPEALTRVYLPLLHLLQTHLGEQRRMVAGLAGIPGSGKSTFAAVLARMADALWGMGRMVAVGLDGWHWPNAVLDSRTITDEAGHSVPLRQRKGGPDSYDVEALAHAVSALGSADRLVRLPVYDRRIHDPVPEGLAIGPGTSIVLIEGNFLLSRQSPWKRVSELLQPKLFLEWEATSARDRVVARHVLGGSTPEEAERKYERNDRLNTEIVLQTADHADYAIDVSGAVLKRG